MYPTQKFKRIGLIVSIILIGCSSATDLLTPDKVGVKARLRVISGQQAAQAVNWMHGQSVAADANVIAEYGVGEKKDILYISRYAEPEEALRACKLMLEKMAAAPKSPFYHLRPIGKYQQEVYMTPGMGAVHYIYPSGKYLLWFQTFQSFGTELPSQLLELYPL